MPIILEKDIEKKLGDAIKKIGGRCDKLVNISFYGFPDRTVFLPDERIFFVETKKPKDSKLAARQKWWRKTLTKMGFSCWVVWNYDDLATFLEYIQKD